MLKGNVPYFADNFIFFFAVAVHLQHDFNDSGILNAVEQHKSPFWHNACYFIGITTINIEQASAWREAFSLAQLSNPSLARDIVNNL